jgi:nucleoid-associated protein YgaU
MLAATIQLTPASAEVLTGDGSVTCGSSYSVAAGDTLSLIAQKAYGDPQLYGFIAQANSDALGGNPENVSVGMELAIPCIDSSGKVLTAEEAQAEKDALKAAVAAVGPLTPDQLDTLFGPVALFPDALLSRLLVAVTFPLDVVKAGRFIEEKADMPDSQRAKEARAEPWDPSVQELAAAFPEVVTRMNDHLDWTEQAGEAVLAQTDDVLASIQRLRVKAQENGYLVDNEAQTVETVDNTIIINPAVPGVVYVPTYQSEVVYTTPISTPPVYYYDDWGNWDDALVAGGIILGGAIILDEIFDDDDWDGWDNWDDDIDLDWDRGDITIDRGDINIDRDEINIGGGDRVQIGDGQIGDGQRGQIGDGTRRDGSDRVSIGDVERPEIARPPGTGARPGVGDRKPVGSAASRDAARAKIESRQATGAGLANLPADRPKVNRPSAGSRQTVDTRPSASNRAPAANRNSNISRPKTTRQPTARAPSRSNSFDRSSGGSRASAASNRGRSSASRGGGGRSGGGGRRR